MGMRAAWQLLLGGMVALWAIAPAAAYAKDIVGYTTPDNTWHLGAKVDDDTLDGFAKVPSSDTAAELYMDLARTIQFSGEDTKVSVMLLILDDRIAGISFDVPKDERSYGFLRRYYKERYGGLDCTVDEADQIAWMDKDNDMLTVYRYSDDAGEARSLVMYMNEDLFDELTGYSVPGWMKDLMKTGKDD